LQRPISRFRNLVWRFVLPIKPVKDLWGELDLY
jgi:hypothetical protein